MSADAGLSTPRMAAVAACLALFLFSPAFQAVRHARMGPAGAGTDPVAGKTERIAAALAVAPAGEAVGYVTDIEEPGYSTSINFFTARYAALPVILRSFIPGQRLVLLDMQSPEGVKAFCAAAGYAILQEGAPGVALASRGR